MEQIMNKVLGMDIATRRRSVEAAVLYVFTVLATFNLFTLSEQWQDWVAKLVICLVEGFVLFYEQHYKNNDHTEVAAEHTGAMRQEKAEQAADYVGERFYTEDLEGVDPDAEADVLVEENVPIEDDIVYEEVKEDE